MVKLSRHGRDVSLCERADDRGVRPGYLPDDDRSVVSQLLHAVDYYRDRGDADWLDAMEGTTVTIREVDPRNGTLKTRVVELETDPEKIEMLFGWDAEEYEFYLDNDDDG
jgi:hypothetical protein